MAPLKLVMRIYVIMRAARLPWLFCHGPIEAPPILNMFVLHVPTSMTILSWPHWSVYIFPLCTLPHRLPWLFCHGPIEAQSQGYVMTLRQTSMTILSWPHWSASYGIWITGVYGTSMTILSWPHWSVFHCMCWWYLHANFHDYFVMAPLKLQPLIATKSKFQTSMTILSWPHWSPADLSVLPIWTLTSMTILSWPHWSLMPSI